MIRMTKIMTIVIIIAMTKNHNKNKQLLLRVVVKNNHMKHYPKDKVTDKEADRIIESISPHTREKLIKLAVDYGITEL